MIASTLKKQENGYEKIIGCNDNYFIDCNDV